MERERDIGERKMRWRKRAGGREGGGGIEREGERKEKVDGEREQMLQCLLTVKNTGGDQGLLRHE